MSPRRNSNNNNNNSNKEGARRGRSNSSSSSVDGIVGFEITQDRIDVMNKAAEFIKTIDDFAGWVDANFDEGKGRNVEQGYRIFEDFVRSTKHIIPKITKLMPPP
jgi:hypothetical protein